MKFTLVDLVTATGGDPLGGAGTGAITTDSRGEVYGAWFMALRGLRFDAHDYVASALASGALGAIIDRPSLPCDRGVRVENTGRALHMLARFARTRLAQQRVPVVGVSGCSGKTTMRELIAATLSPLGHVHRNRANDNNHVGVPMTLLATPESSAAVVLELGSSAPGEMLPLAEMSTPNVRLCVNIHPAHLQTLGTLQAVRKEEGSLLDMAADHDTVVLNADDDWLASDSYPGRVIRYGCAFQADVRLVSCHIDAATWSTDATWSVHGETLQGRISAPGRHMAHNATGALAVALALGVPLHAAINALTLYQPVGRRLRRLQAPSGLVIIDDCYNANPASVRASLALQRQLEGRRFAILGDMLELGEAQGVEHLHIMEFTEHLDGLCVIGPAFAEAAKNTGAYVARDPADAAKWLASQGSLDGASVLVKASRGMHFEHVVDLLIAGDSP